MNIKIAKIEKPYKGMSIHSIGGKWHLMRGQVSNAQADKGYRSLKAIHKAIDKIMAQLLATEPAKEKP
jgi:hypothetical protein